MTDEHDTETHYECLEELDDLVHEDCMRLETTKLELFLDVLKELIVHSILHHSCGEQILHNSIEERKIVL